MVFILSKFTKKIFMGWKIKGIIDIYSSREENKN